MRTLVLAAGLAAALATPAWAADLTASTAGFTYFHKPGATIAGHDNDVAECRRHAMTFRQPYPEGLETPYGTDPLADPLAGAIGAVIAGAIIQSVESVSARPVNIENCMVARGWAVVRLPAGEESALKDLDQAGRRARLEALVAAKEPHGEVVRVFRNDVLYGARVFERARVPDKRSLSIGAYDDGEDTKPAKPPKVRRKLDPGFVKAEAFPPDSTPDIPAGKAVIMFRVVKPWRNRTVTFTRVGPDGWTAAGMDGQIEVIRAEFPKPWRKTTPPADTTVAFLVPAGRWAISSYEGISYLANVRFCHGAPAFDVASGEIVYAGTFSPDVSLGLLPDLDLTPARHALTFRPDIVSSVRAAVYRNGAMIPCGGLGYGYALEMPGAPFLEGFAYGGAARPYAPEDPVVQTGPQSTGLRPAQPAGS